MRIRIENVKIHTDAWTASFFENGYDGGRQSYGPIRDWRPNQPIPNWCGIVNDKVVILEWANNTWSDTSPMRDLPDRLIEVEANGITHLIWSKEVERLVCEVAGR